jgi:ankyrin repeat protein
MNSNAHRHRRSTPAPRALRDATETPSEKLERVQKLLMDCAANGRAERMASLVRKGADPLPLLNMDSTPGRTCILLSAAKSKSQCFDIVWSLMPASSRRAKIMMAMEKALDFPVDRLLALCAEIRAFGFEAARIEQCLNRAVRAGQIEKAYALLSLFPPEARFGSELQTPAMLLARCLCREVVVFNTSLVGEELLLATLDGADIDELDAQGRSLLNLAAYHRHVPLCKLLIGHGANPFLPDKRGLDCIRHLESSSRKECLALAASLRAQREAQAIAADIALAPSDASALPRRL